jgi:hypothetical protein
MDRTPNPIQVAKTTAPMSVADQIAKRTADDKTKHQAIHQESIKRKAKEQVQLNQIAGVRNGSHYKTARKGNDIILSIAFLNLVVSPIYCLYFSAIPQAITAVVSSLALIVLTSVAKAIFDIADRVTSGD